MKREYGNDEANSTPRGKKPVKFPIEEADKQQSCRNDNQCERFYDGYRKRQSSCCGQRHTQTLAHADVQIVGGHAGLAN